MKILNSGIILQTLTHAESPFDNASTNILEL